MGWILWIHFDHICSKYQTACLRSPPPPCVGGPGVVELSGQGAECRVLQQLPDQLVRVVGGVLTHALCAEWLLLGSLVLNTNC